MPDSTDKDRGDLKGKIIHPGKIAEWIQRPMRELLSTLLTCLMNPRIYVLLDAGDGATSKSKDAEIKMGANGWTAKLDLTQVTGGSGGSLELTDGTHDLTGVTKITVTNMTVGGTAAAATLVPVATAIVKVLHIKTSGAHDAGDYYDTDEGIKVAKQYKNRPLTGPTSETIRGTTYNYSYTHDVMHDEYTRGTTGGASTTDYMTPPALAGQEIIAVSAPGILTGVDWVEVTERKWASA